MLQYQNPLVKNLLFQGRFGLEKESLRITPSARLASTPHPFDDPCIVKDFSEAQPEINTPCYTSLWDALRDMTLRTLKMEEILSHQNEMLWPFSSPCLLEGEQNIPISNQPAGKESAYTYRKHLITRYGAEKMTFCGIHFNFSFSEELLTTSWQTQGCPDTYRIWKDQLYLDLLANLIRNGWLINVLMSASPILDSSYFKKEPGKSLFLGMASCRCSEIGYWNHFTPFFDCSSIASYCDSIQSYVDRGMLQAPSELYYPIRLKPAGSYSLSSLKENGVSHIELRMLDLNPFQFSGLDDRDALFLHLFLIWMACLPSGRLSHDQQVDAIANFKASARYDLEGTLLMDASDQALSISDAAFAMLEEMMSFYQEVAPCMMAVIARQMLKITDPDHHRLANAVKKVFSSRFLIKGEALAEHRQRQALDLLKKIADPDNSLLALQMEEDPFQDPEAYI